MPISGPGIDSLSFDYQYFLFWTCMSEISNRESRLYISLNW